VSGTPTSRDHEPDPAGPTLRTVLDAVPHRVVVVDAAERVLLVNAAVWEGLGLDPSLAPPGMPFRDFVRLVAFRGIYGPGDPEAHAEAALRLDRRTVTRRVTRGADGRVFELHSVPMAGGGFVISASELTAHLAAEREATARARRLERVLQQLRSGVAQYDSGQRLVLFNPAYAELVGLDRDEVRPGLTLTEVLRKLAAAGEFTNADADSVVRQRAAMDRSRPTTYQRERPSGEVLRFRSQPMPDGGFLIEVAEVTALKRAEDEARRRAALLDGVLEALPHGVAIWGPDRRLARVNAAYGRIMRGAPIAAGDGLEEVIRRRARAGEFGPGDPEEIARRELGRPLDRPQARHRVRPDGTAIEVRTAPLPDGGWVSVVTDVTELHRAREEASRRAEILTLMLENTRHGICLFDAEGNVVAANALAARMTGLTPEELAPGRNLADLRRLQLARGEFGEGPAAAAWLATRPGIAEGRRYERTRPNGMAIEVTTDPTPDGGFVRTYTDVTADRRAQEELRRAKEAAEAASRAKSRFLAMMSHELRTPLNAVIGFSEALLAQPGLHGPAQEYARAIHDAGRHLLSLIEDVLDVARAATTGFEVTEAPLDPAALAEGVVRVMQAAAGAAGLALSLRLEPGLPRLRADERRLRQVLLNLISNAVKFTPTGGSVTLSAAIEPATGDLLFRVTDSGIGMPAEDIPRAFEPFTQLDDSLARRFAGSGLGLPLSRALVEAQGGGLTLESAPGAGTTATVRLPRERLLPPEGAAAEGAMPA
jgi:PAS domain S-box-containing protein